MKSNRRRIRLIRPRLQMRLILAFAGVASLALVLQVLLVANVLSDIAVRLPRDGNLLLEAVPGRLFVVFGISLAVLLPLTLWVGVLVTHRIAGPVYRIETYLKDALAGRVKQDCKLRHGDELQELCELVNQVTEPMRRQQSKPPAIVRDPSDRAA